MKVLMVCLGNICRSPLAEGILKHKIKEKKLDWKISSAGTGHWHIGESPDLRSIDIARKYGLDISMQTARQFTAEDFNEYDKIYVMDRNNYQHLLSMARTDENKRKIELILDNIYPGEEKEVPDPYWDDDGFEHVYRLLDQACEKIIERASKE